MSSGPSIPKTVSDEAKRVHRDAKLERWCASHPELARAWESARGREIPAGFEERLLKGLAEKAQATRQYSGQALARLVEEVPYLVGGSADLAGSNNTTLPSAGFVGPGAGEGVDPFVGSNVHFGVREHAMGAIANGLALDGTFRGRGIADLLSLCLRREREQLPPELHRRHPVRFDVLLHQRRKLRASPHHGAAMRSCGRLRRSRVSYLRRQLQLRRRRLLRHDMHRDLSVVPRARDRWKRRYLRKCEERHRPGGRL